MSNFSERLNAARGDESIRSVARRAAELGQVGESTLYPYFREEHPRPSVQAVVALALALNLPSEELLAIAELPPEGLPWSPPVSSRLMNDRQRRAVNELIRAITAPDEREALQWRRETDTLKEIRKHCDRALRATDTLMERFDGEPDFAGIKLVIQAKEGLIAILEAVVARNEERLVESTAQRNLSAELNEESQTRARAAKVRLRAIGEHLELSDADATLYEAHQGLAARIEDDPKEDEPDE
ncbi:hypothetical protein AB0K45_11790 [Micrococcus luteus]|uniref:hypothetical protein n=1 Tax=Micrococcus luteus TaxID=1270 RepID=UPI003413429B